MINLSTWAIKKPVPSLALFLVLCLIGLVSFSKLPITFYPTVDIPIISVVIAQPGAAPLELTNQVIKPVENAVKNVTDVAHITATASNSVAQFVIEFNLAADTDRALNGVKDALASIRGDLPKSISEPMITKLDLVGLPILNYTVSDATMTVEELSTFVDEVIAKEIQAAKGVSKIVRAGGAQREIRVELDPKRMLALGITAAEVNNQLRATNVNLGGGRGVISGQEFSIRTLGSANDIEKLAAMPLSLASGNVVRLDQLGVVSDGASEMRTFAMQNGQSVIAFSVYRANGASDVVAGKGAKQNLYNLQQKYPNLQVDLITDNTVKSEGSYKSAMATLYEGAALAVLVVFLFLKNWRATLITAIALPLSIIPTFFVMQYLGFSLNLISLLGITLVTGILVDDAIVEIENIIRHIHAGKTAYEASMEAAEEIGLTVVAISLTIIAVFVPVSFMDGIIGQFFKQFGLTVAVAVAFSLLVARLITPMIAAYFLKDGVTNPEPEKDGLIMRIYIRVLNWTLRNRTVTLLSGVMLFAISLYSATLLPQEFDTPIDDGIVNINIQLPPGSTLEDTRETALIISEKILAVPELQSVFVNGGAGGISQASIIVNFGTKTSRKRSVFVIEDDLKALLEDVADIRLNFLTANGVREVIINIQGDEIEATSQAALMLANAMKNIESVEQISSNASLTQPEIQISPKFEIAAELGVTASSLASVISIATLGESESYMAKFNTGTKQIPINIRLEKAARQNLVEMQYLRIPDNKGGSVPLGVVADISISNGPSLITRYDQSFQVSVEADLADGFTLGTATNQAFALVDGFAMPEGTRLALTGDAKMMEEMMDGFAIAMGAGILLVYVVLVILFSSFITPITILMSLPLAIGGAIFALYIGNYSISISVIIGFLMLMGIVTKNAIMLVDFALGRIKDGIHRNIAIIDASHKRARPIIMTTIAMTAGMVPSALAFGDGGEFRAPMAVAVIGGLITSTLLSLLFVPSLFSVVNGLKVWIRHHIVHTLGANQAPVKDQ